MIKQETLEETAEREYPKEGEDSTYCDLGLIQQDAFKFGIKWQQEKSYTEEDMLAFGKMCKNYATPRDVKKVLEQFKKK